MITILIVLLTVVCFAGLTTVALNAFASGASAYRGTYSEATSRQFEDIFLFIPPRRIAEIGWIGAILTTVLVFLSLGGVGNSTSATLVRFAVGLAMGAIMLMAPGQLLVILRNRRRRRFNEQLVDALTSMGNALKSGFSIMQALEHVVQNGESPISEEFATTLHQTRVGVSFQDAMHNMDQRVGSEDLTLMVLSIETARRTGGNLTDVFANISHTIQERFRVENRIRTLTAQGRMQGIILGLMPLALAMVLFLVKPQMVQPFVHSAAGIAIIMVCVVMIVIGGFWIRKIIKINI